MHGTTLAGNGNKCLAVWAACERDNIPISATPKRNSSQGAGGPIGVIDIKDLTGPNDEFCPEVWGECA